MNDYEPSAWIREHSKWPCKGLSSIVARARRQGYTVFIDFCDDGDFEAVNSKNVVYAVNEVDEATLHFEKGDQRGWIYVIPSNDEDWLCDYTVNITDLVEGNDERNA